MGSKARMRREAAALAAWQAQRDRVESFLSRLRTFVGATNADAPTLPLQLADQEHALLVLTTVQLVEPRRLPGHFMGGNSGFSFPVAPDTGDGEATPVDMGVVTLTDRRAVFSGSLHTRTWDYATVIGYHSNAHPPWTAIAVSDRQTISGILYDSAHADEFRFALALGLARCHNAEASLVDDLTRQLEELDQARPLPTPLHGPVLARTVAGSGPSPGPESMSPVGALTGAPASLSRLSPSPTPSGPSPATASAAPTLSGLPAASAGPAPSSTVPVSPAPGSVLAPAGWYPDPYRTARLRWWDGRSWTAHGAP